MKRLLILLGILTVLLVVGCVSTSTHEPYFKIVQLVTNSPVEIGETLTAEAEIKNLGSPAEQQVAFYFDSTKKDSREVTLETDESTTCIFTLDTASYTAGEYQAKIVTENEIWKETVTLDATSEAVKFHYEHLGEGKYKFIASHPKNAKFWEWKFPKEEYWWGFVEDNEVVYDFSSYEDEEVLVRLRIFDEDENLLGEAQQTIILF